MLTRTAGLVVVVLLVATGSARAQSGQELYQQGVAKAQLGDYDDAIKIFDRITREASGNRPLVAKAKLQMVDCWLKQGNAKALDLLNDVYKNYRDMPEVIGEARRLDGRTNRVSRLTDKDVLVVPEFSNTTGDAAFDVALRQALVFQIEQSPFLRIMDGEQMQQALRFLGRPVDTRLTKAVAHDVCVREQEKATLEGSISKVGNTYLVTLEAFNCQYGMTALAREQATAKEKDGVLKAVADAATGMRVKLGESLSSIESVSRTYADGTRVTTSSLEAFREFALGEAEYFKGSELIAVAHYRRATELDPAFAMAFGIAGSLYRNLFQTSEANEFFDRAYALLDHVSSERERLWITRWHYERLGELDKVLKTLELLTRAYPRDAIAHGDLGALYKQNRENEKALLEYQAEIREAPRAWSSYRSLAEFYMTLDRIDDAKDLVDKAISSGMDAPALHKVLLRIATVRNDRAAKEREWAWFAGKPEEFDVLPDQARELFADGQPRKSREVLARARLLTERAGLDGQTYQRLERQIELLQAGTFPLSLGARGNNNNNNVEREQLTLYGNALTLLSERKADEAAAEFQKIQVPLGVPLARLLYVFARVGLARSFAMAGDTARAGKAYEEFFTLWKNAEPDVPLLLDARREYAALHQP
jgi:tetratricopeptide (TPR) repeat protein